MAVLAIPDKRQKDPFLKDKIYKKVLDFKEKQKCNICDFVCEGDFFIIVFSFPLSLE